MKIGDVVRNKMNPTIVGTIDSKYIQVYGSGGNAWNVKLDSDGTIVAYYEDSLELLASAAISTPKFKVGDKVLVNYSSVSAGIFYVNKPATITQPIGSGSWSVIFDDGNIDGYAECYLTLANPAQNISKKQFQKGDLVYVTGQNFTGSGVISNVYHGIMLGSINSYEFIADIDGQTRSALPNQVSDINAPHVGSSGQPYAYIQPGLQTYTTSGFSSGGSARVTFPQGMYIGGMDTNVKPEVKTGCNVHKWRFYQGLNSRFEFCEVCDVKRDTDKRL